MKTNRNHRITKRNKAGFSLVEMLVVIAVIGILAGLAVAGLSNTNEQAKTASAKRNAQSLCSLHSSAVSGGAGFSATTKEGITDELIAGKSATDLGGVAFKMSPLSDDDKTAALAYCSYDSSIGALTYHEEGLGGEIVNGGGGNEEPLPPAPDPNVGWYDLIIVRTAIAGWYVANQDQMHPQDYHRAIPVGDGTNSMIQYKPKA